MKGWESWSDGVMERWNQAVAQGVCFQHSNTPVLRLSVWFRSFFQRQVAADNSLQVAVLGAQQQRAIVA